MKKYTENESNQSDKVKFANLKAKCTTVQNKINELVIFNQK